MLVDLLQIDNIIYNSSIVQFNGKKLNILFANLFVRLPTEFVYYLYFTLLNTRQLTSSMINRYLPELRAVCPPPSFPATAPPLSAPLM